MPAVPETQFRPRLPARRGKGAAVLRFAIPVILLLGFAITGVCASGRYGTPLHFPPPPVDVEGLPAPSAEEQAGVPPLPKPAPAYSAPVRRTPAAPPPVESAPAVPVAPVPVESAPVEAVPVAPLPVESTPVVTVPVAPLPVESTPVVTVPVAPEPVEALPVAPAPVESAPVAAPPPAPAEAQQTKPTRLFGTVEFRSALKNLPKWERVLTYEKQTPTFASGGKMPANVRPRWEKLEAELRGKPRMEQVQRVNNFFNQWPYKTDAAVWGVEDYWAIPPEFMQKSGDCEDYAISKYYALRSLGIPASQLRIVVLKDTLRNLGHGVLAFIDGDQAYILDNLTNLVLSHHKLTHYDPQFSVNEEYLWRHVKPVARQPGK